MAKRISRTTLRESKYSMLNISLFSDNHAMFCLNLHRPDPACFFLHLEGEETKKLYLALFKTFGASEGMLAELKELAKACSLGENQP